MKSFVRRLLLVGLAVLVALPLAAAQQEKKKKGGGAGPVAALKKQIAQVELTDEQKKKVEAIIAEHQPKVAAAMKEGGAAQKMVEAAKKQLKSDGKKGKELNEGAVAAAKLTDEQKAGYEKLQKAVQDMRAAVAATLTPEQRERAGLAKGKKKNK
ncbi:MAG: hypothetical protein AB7O38_12225 [Pirellulaceae bacterium]